MVEPALPLLQQELGIGPAEGALIANALLVTGAVATPVAGRLGDRYGGKRVLVRLMAVVVAGGLLASVAPGLPVLLRQVLQGVMVGALPLFFILVRGHLPAGRSQVAIGLVVALFTGGGTVGTLVAGPIAEFLSWHAMFALPTLVIAVTTPVVSRLMPDNPPLRPDSRVDWPGMVLLSGTLLAFMLGLVTVTSGGLPPFAVGALALTVAGLATCWVAVERRTASPMVDLRMLARPATAHAYLFTFLVTISSGMVLFLVPSAVAGGAEGQDLEVRRGDLTGILHALVRDDVKFLFGDRVDTLDPGAQGVDVAFRSGRRRTFDLVIGADGMHSHTRELRFGPEERFHRHLGHCFAVFTVPNTYGLSRELVMWNAPGKAAALYAVAGDDRLHAFLTFHRPGPPLDTVLRGPAARRDLLATAFAGAAWEVPRLIDALSEADDLFFDTAGQIRMPHWSSGRVALVGDAAYAPSFLTGQGTSLALCGAYVLADALAARRDHTAAFAAYERGLRGYVTMNQALADNGLARLFPTTAQALEQRNTMLRGLVTLPTAPARPAHSALALPESVPPASPPPRP
ncbi:MFS transporter [Streptomyces sp. NPDC057197]|uniref:MFS transporter n=1 Tax=Streptomyces sp. NPDC057197 TaxID=3346045 RepID=UPI00362A0553